jgi:hypothetical protein
MHAEYSKTMSRDCYQTQFAATNLVPVVGPVPAGYFRWNPPAMPRSGARKVTRSSGRSAQGRAAPQQALPSTGTA